MLAKDIKIGGQYMTYVGQNKVLVEVVQDRKTAGRRYLVRRVDNGMLLASKLRAPSALHPAGDHEWPGAMNKQERLSGARSGCGPQQSCFGNQLRGTRGLGKAGGVSAAHYTIWRIRSGKHEEKVVVRPARADDWKAQTQYQRIITQVSASSAEEALQMSCAAGQFEVEPIALSGARSRQRARRPIPRVGTRVQFNPVPASLALYTSPPKPGELGTVTTVAFPGGKRLSYMPGPGGGLLYVKWDKSGHQGVSLIDVQKPSSMRVGPGRPGMKFSPSDDVEITTTLHPIDFD